MSPFARPARAAAAIALATLACAAGAQVYRIVGPDGRVTFSDKPPADAGARAVPTAAAGTAGEAGGNSALPYELRQVASRYPVTLYTGPDCGPCGTARAFLGSRGVPYTEKTVSTNEDVAALQRLSGGASLPFLTIGTQQLTGYSEGEWMQFLDAAGYPRKSQLPASYRNPPASPLVAAAAAPAPRPAPAPAAAPVARQAPAAAPAPAANNPAGIQF